jgi:Aldehyde dehydrogenase family
LLKAVSQANQKMMSKRDEEHMMVPTRPTTHLGMVKAEFAFGFFEDGLNWLAHTTDQHEIALEHVSRAVAEVVFDQAVSSRLRRMIHQSSPANFKEAFAFANQVDVGVLKINESTTALALNAPFSGFKQSSANTFKEPGQTDMDFYTCTKTIYVNHG